MLEEAVDLSFRIENLPKDSYNGVKVIIHGKTTPEMVNYPADFEIGSTEILPALEEASFDKRVRIMFKLGTLEFFKASMLTFKSVSTNEVAWKTKEVTVSPFHILRNNGTHSQILPTPSYNLNTATILNVNAQPGEPLTPCTYFQFAGHALSSKNNHPINAYFSFWLFPKNESKLNLPVLLYRSEVLSTKDPKWRGFTLPNKLLGTSSDGTLKITCHNMNSNHADSEIGHFFTNFYQLLKGSGPMNKYILRHDSPTKKKEEMSMELIDIRRAESPISISSIIASGEQFHTTVAIDFSTHNGAANESTSLHASYPSPSLYEKRLMQIALDFKNHGFKTAYLGFGCKIPNNYGHMEMSNCFALNGDIVNPFCESVQQVEAMYRSRAINSLFYAPTNFAPIIAHVRKQAIAAEKIKRPIRFVLVILTNGTISDNHAIKDSIEEITKCSKYPISIVFIGIGNTHHPVNTNPNSPFMKLLCQEGKTANNEVQEKEVTSFIDSSEAKFAKIFPLVAGKMKTLILLLIIFVDFCFCNSTVYWNQYSDTRNSPQSASTTTESSIVKYFDTGLRRAPALGNLEVAEINHNEGNNECMTDTDLLNAVLRNGYTKHRVPDDNGVEVTVEFWIQEISAISELTRDFEMDLYVNELWYDKNLNFTHLPSCKENITLDHTTLNKVWMPNNCFITTKLAEIHDSPFKNVFFTLFRNGTIWVNYRVKVRGPCTMDLSNFPMDSQNCSLVYLSFNYNNEEVKLRWNNDRPDPVYPLRDLLLPDFDLKGIIPEVREIIYPAGKWDSLAVTFTFKRRYVWYFMQAFIPTYLTIFVSWIAFSLSPRAIPARTLLGVNAILAQIFQFGSMRNMLPRVSYIKAIDVWILGSMTFVFASLVELAVIGYQAKKHDAKKKRRLIEYDEQMTGQPTIYTEGAISMSSHHLPEPSMLCCGRDSSFVTFLMAQQVDFYAKLLFPAFYSLFNQLAEWQSKCKSPAIEEPSEIKSGSGESSRCPEEKISCLPLKYPEMARGDDCCYLCNECPNSFATLDELESHMAEDHLAKKTAQTEQGPSSIKQESLDGEDGSDTKMDLEMNEIEEQIPGHSPTSSDSSNMSDGDEKFSIGNTPPLFLGTRIAGHSCRICGRAFSDRGQLNVHYTHTHRDKPQYECEHCQAVFCVKRELSTHLRIHSGEQPHKCDICGKEFGTRQLLKKHNMWHSGERSHVCPTCGKAFFQKGHLTQHLMIHKGGRPHRCTQCEKTFIFKFDLNRHMKIHVERGHSCGKCGKSFLKQSSLEEHSGKCKGTIGSPPTASTRTSTPLSDISRQESPGPTPLSRRLSNTSINIPNSQQQIHSPFHMLSNMIKNENSPAEATVAPMANSVFNTQFLMSQFNSTEEQVNAAQNLMAQYNEQNQQRLLMMTAAQRLLGLNQSPQVNQNGLNSGLFCHLCNKTYPNAAAFTLHYSLMHLKNNGTIQQEDENELKLQVCQKTEELMNVHSDSATSSSCASSPQKVSPVSHAGSDHKFCDQCDHLKHKTSELEKELEKANDELNRMREVMKKFNALAGSLLGTQQLNQGSFELDKLWAFPLK